MSKFRIVSYENHSESTWDEFVWRNSANGGLFHTRKFLNYHLEDRFTDCSIMIYDNQKLLAVYPACIEGNQVFSHGGSSAGGPVIHRKYFRYSVCRNIIQSIREFYGTAKLTVKIPESVFFEYSNDPLLYIYSNCGYKISYELGSYKLLGADLLQTIPKQTSRNIIRRLLNSEDYGVLVAREVGEYIEFHRVLCENLLRHQTSPTHRLEEFLMLRNLLADSQLLLLAKDSNFEVLGGVWLIKATGACWHTQYIARNHEHMANGIVETMLFRCFEIAKANGARFLNLGISTEKQGAYVNEKLLGFKEGLGTIQINRYIIESE